MSERKITISSDSYRDDEKRTVEEFKNICYNIPVISETHRTGTKSTSSDQAISSENYSSTNIESTDFLADNERSSDTKSYNNDHCEHTINDEGVCTKCGMMTESFSTEIQPSQKTKYRSFEPDLAKLSFDQDIKSEVIRIASSVSEDQIHRMGKRTTQLFVYLYLAHLRLRGSIEPQKIAEELKMSEKQLNEATKIVSGVSNTPMPLPKIGGETLSAPVVIISPLAYLNSLCMQLGINDTCSKIKDFGAKIIAKNPLLLEQSPDQVAIGIIKYYMETHNIVNLRFLSIVKRSDNTVKMFRDLVALADNS